MKIRIAAPGMKAQPPAQSLSTEAAPSIRQNSATEPMIGHCVPCGM